MRDLLIAGDGVHGQEMVEIVERINRQTPTWNLIGFLTSSTDAVGVDRNDYPVLGHLEVLDTHPNAAIVADNEWPALTPLPQNRLVSLVDPSTFVSRTALIGVGCVIYPNCFIGLNARIGNYVFCLAGTVINHDDVIEDRVVFASGVALAGSVYVETGCYLGQSCTVRQSVRIGQGSLIGMGAVVLGDVPAHTVIVGNPGRPLRQTANTASVRIDS